MRPVRVDQPMRILEEVLEVLEFGVDEARVDGEDEAGFLEVEVEGADEEGEGGGVVVVAWVVIVVVGGGGGGGVGGVGVELGDAEGGEGGAGWRQLCQEEGDGSKYGFGELERGRERKWGWGSVRSALR